MLDLNNCDKICLSCIKGYVSKHNLRKNDKFSTPCNGIPKDFIPLPVLQSINETERITAQGLFDPVIWASQTIDWHCLDPDGSIWKRKNPDEYDEWIRQNPNKDILGSSRYHRPYQSTMLRCLHSDTDILMADRTVKKIKDIEVGDKVITYNEDRKTIQSSYEVINKWNNGIRDLYKIELDNGDILKVTDNHPILSWSHQGKLNELVNEKFFKCIYKSLKDGLSIGDKVYALNKLEISQKKDGVYLTSIKSIEDIGKDEVWDIEVEKRHNFIANGIVVHNCSSKRKVFRIGRQCLSGDSRILLSNGLTKEIKDIIIGDDIISVRDDKLIPSKVRDHWFSGKKIVYEIKTKFGHTIKCTSGHRFLIENFIGFNKNWLSIDSGLEENSKIAIPYQDTYKDNLSDAFGDLIWDTVTSIKKLGLEDTWDIEVNGPSNFIANEILTHNSGKCLVSGTLIRMSDGTNKPIELVNDHDLVTSITGDHKFVINKAFRACNGKKDVLRIKLTDGKQIETTYNHPFLRDDDRWIEAGNLTTEDFLVVSDRSEDISFVKIDSIEKTGNKMTWDLTVPETHNFIANDIITHNTESLVVSMLFNLFNKPGVPDNEGFKIIVITPYQSQIDLIFTRLMQLIESAPILKNSIKRNVKSPNYTIELYNNSVVKGFTAGTKSAGNAEAVRGQCLPGDTLITMVDGSYKRLDTVKLNDEILSFDDKNIKIKPARVEALLENGADAVRKITLSCGKEISATSEHPFFTIDSWTKTKDLKLGDRIATISKLRRYRHDDIVWETIVDLDWREPVETFNLTISDTHTFIANDIITHNTANMLVFDESDFLCVASNTLVEKEDGALVEIKNINAGDQLHSFDKGSIISRVGFVAETKKQALLRISSSFSEIETTPEHKHFVLGKNTLKEKLTSQLTLKDYIIHPIEGILGKRSVDVKWCELAGFFWGDGHKASFYSKHRNTEEMKYYRNLTEEFNLSQQSLMEKFKKNFNSLYLNREIGPEISTLDRKSLSGFLRGVFDTRGKINIGKNIVNMSSDNKASIKIIRLLLHKLGILSLFSVDKSNWTPIYSLSINESKFLRIFLKNIGFNCFQKQRNLISCVKNISKNKKTNLVYSSEYCSTVFLSIADKINEDFAGIKALYKSIEKNIDPTLYDLEKIQKGLIRIGEVDLSMQVKELYSSFYSSKIKFLEKQFDDSGFETIDISVPKTKSFFANGMLTHNSSADMDAAMSIVTNYPNATIWMSSTPSGKRERFYETCLSKRFKEFHYPSSVNPLWSKDLEEGFREDLTELGYIHEVEANFGEQEQGVFQNAYVQAAKKQYEYGEYEYHRNWTYTVGVDWNDTKNGTTINVLGLNPNNNIFYVVDRHVISREGWTQLSACEKIKDVNRLWLPLAIYVDAGYGATQLEILKKFGWDSLQDKTKGANHPDSRLREIVKSYNFGSTVEAYDLFTKQKIQKHAKPFLVEQTVRRFESGDIAFPESDEKLEKQLLGYIIDRVTPTGVSVYKAGNIQAGDHALDALMLSVVAFTLEATPLGKPKYSSYMAYSGQFGQQKDGLVHEGDTVVKNNQRRNFKKDSKPITNRSSTMEEQGLFLKESLPASNINNNNNVSLWRWEGFSTDQPKPKVRTLEEAGSDARQKTGFSSKRSGRPKRKNI